jgi:hypothetical protein
MLVSRYKAFGLNNQNVPCYSVFKTIGGARRFAARHLSDAGIVDIKTNERIALEKNTQLSITGN